MNLRRNIKNNVAGDILKAFHSAQFLLDLHVQLSSGATGLEFGRILQLHPFCVQVTKALARLCICVVSPKLSCLPISTKISQAGWFYFMFSSEMIL